MVAERGPGEEGPPGMEPPEWVRPVRGTSGRPRPDLIGVVGGDREWGAPGGGRPGVGRGSVGGGDQEGSGGSKGERRLVDKIFEKVISPYLTGVLQHPQSIEMREGMLHIRDVEGPKKTGGVEARLEAMEQQVFKCQGMMERELNANHMMITEFTSKHRINANDIGKHLSRLYDTIDQLQA
ncbi:40S ribosomal protein S5-1 [Hordeum vulgare]|nr:40S ribosomal protein S5-1 [Hordeum vulgare]